MRNKSIFVLAFLVILVQCMASEEHNYHSNPEPSQSLLIPTLVSDGDYKEFNSRAKRQTRGRNYPLPIMGGGGGYPINGARGYPGRGFGGRGAGGRGFGGRGIGGRGGFGGGRGGFGGGRGGRG